MRTPPGERLNTKFDGKDYPVEDDPGRTLVSAKLLNADTVELTSKRNGEVVAIKPMSVMPDRKSIEPSICGNIRPDWTESSAKWKLCGYLLKNRHSTRMLSWLPRRSHRLRW